RGRPRFLAQRPLPSMMMAICRGKRLISTWGDWVLRLNNAIFTHPNLFQSMDIPSQKYNTSGAYLRPAGIVWYNGVDYTAMSSFSFSAVRASISLHRL